MKQVFLNISLLILAFVIPKRNILIYIAWNDWKESMLSMYEGSYLNTLLFLTAYVNVCSAYLIALFI